MKPLYANYLLSSLFAALIALSSCSHKDHTGPAPSNDLVATISLSEQAGGGASITADSFVYNPGNSLKALYFNQAGTNLDTHILFDYNGEGMCSHASWFGQDGKKFKIDSIVYAGTSMTVYEMDGNSRPEETYLFTLNSDKQIVLLGSKDTVRKDDTKQLDYTEFTYVNGNPQKIVLQQFYQSGQNDPSTSHLEDSFTNDNRTNPLWPLFRQDPYLLYTLNENVLIYSFGKNTMTSAMMMNSDGSNTTINFVNTYDPGAGNLTQQKFTLNSNAYTLSYQYKKP